MADPTKYTPGFDYSDWEEDNPTEPKPGAQLDNDFANIERSIDETIDALGDIRRSDGAMNNGIVTLDALHTSVKAAIASDEYDYEALEDLLQKNANLSDVTDAATARDNLGVLARSANLADVGDAGEAVANLGLQDSRTYQTIAEIENANVANGVGVVRVAGGDAAGDGEGGLYVDQDNGREVAFTSGGTTARDWYRADDSVGAAVWDSGTFRTMQERARDTYCILDAPGQPDPTGANDSTTALKAMIAEGVKCEITKGDFVTTEPLIVRTAGQIIAGQGGGYGYGGYRGSEGPLEAYRPLSRIIASGTAARRVMTRRKYRASAADPNDDAMSALLDIEEEGVLVRDLTLWLNCDYSDDSPTNEGDEWDIGLFVGCRPGFQEHNVQVLGYWRKAARYFDVTRGRGIPELLDYDGNSLPSGSPDVSGGDGTHLWNPYSRGGRIGLAVLGSRDLGSGDYYDEVTGLTYSDRRGGSGFSDFATFGGRIFGPTHHSGYRRADPTGYGSALTRANMEAEDDFAPAAMFIDGDGMNSGSTTHGLGALRGMQFFGTRFASYDMFRVRLGRCDEITFAARGWIEAGDGGLDVKDTSGTSIDLNDYDNVTYGHIAANSTETGAVHADRVTGGINQTWVEAEQFTGSSAGGASLQRSQRIAGDASSQGAAADALSEVQDTAAAANEKGGQHIRSEKPFVKLEDKSSGLAFSMFLESSALQFATGTHSTGQPLDTLRLSILSSSGSVRPGADNDQSFGTAGLRWSDIYAASGTVNTSDATIKRDVADTALGLGFIKALRPVEYKFQDTTQKVQSRRYFLDEDGKYILDDEGNPTFETVERTIDQTFSRPHQGLIAQEVKAVLDDLGIDFAGYIDPSASGEEGPLGLRYTEFVAPLIKAVQELAARVEALENGE